MSLELINDSISKRSTNVMHFKDSKTKFLVAFIIGVILSNLR